MSFDGGDVYMCPMHPQVRQGRPGRCSRCNMPLVPEGAHFDVLRHIMASPANLVIMGTALAALTLTAVLLVR